MKRNIIAAAIIAAAFTTAGAQTEVLKIELNNGTTQTIAVESIKEMTFAIEEEEEESMAEKIAGEYTGTNSVVVGGNFTYTADITAAVTANEDGTVNFTWPEYNLSETVMGELTLGTVTIPKIPYDESKGGFYLDYSDKELTQHFKAVQNGTATMDKDYTLGATSTILIEMTDTGIKVSNPFKLGAMPLPITATFEGSKK